MNENRILFFYPKTSHSVVKNTIRDVSFHSTQKNKNWSNIKTINQLQEEVNKLDSV